MGMKVSEAGRVEALLPEQELDPGIGLGPFAAQGVPDGGANFRRDAGMDRRRPDAGAGQEVGGPRAGSRFVGQRCLVPLVRGSDRRCLSGPSFHDSPSCQGQGDRSQPKASVPATCSRESIHATLAD